MNELLTLSGAARELGISRPVLRRLIKDGRIPFHRVGDSVRLNAKEVVDATRVVEPA